MRTFIHELAKELYTEYGDDVSSLNILFPSRRARLFFNDSLSSLAGKPIWQPNYISIDELMELASGMHSSDNIRLIAELYKSYSKYHKESFDTFYFWGEILLSDFDSMDKYLIDAAMLFINIADLKEMESDLSFLTPEQIEIIRIFWHNFNIDELTSPEKQHFVSVWNTLLDIYNDYRERLRSQGMAYQGMVYRNAAEQLRSRNAPEQLFAKEYIIAGFNALSESEKILFDQLTKRKCARFFWDYDTYYTKNEEQEAGMFIRDNIRRFPQDKIQPCSEFIKDKELVVIAAPSDAMQCKYVTQFIQSIDSPDKNTAVVLTDENLLLPVLHSIPSEVDKINVTMGYPLRQTPAYTFVERLIELQQHKKSGAFYHSDVLGLLNHPYIRSINKSASNISEDIITKQYIYVSAKTFSADQTLSLIFSNIEGWENICQYILSVISLIEAELKNDSANDLQRDFFLLIAENIHKLENTLIACKIEITLSVLFSLLRKVLQTVRVPYEGEPLEGVQVMGILETRNLDFENVVILSVNDDTFPGNLSTSSSFIPFNLRLAYGLPTPQHHEGVFGYYFYRLIQRAKRVHIVYSVKTDDKKTGEPSRYIYQLDYESPHNVIHKDITLNINFSGYRELLQPKTDEIMTVLNNFLNKEGKRRLSPSSLYTYIECPMKFYYQSVVSLREGDEINEDVDLPMFGNIFHKAAELIYGELINKINPEKLIATLRGSSKITDTVTAAINSEFFKGETSEFGGNIALIRDIVSKYLNNCLLNYDSKNGGFIVSEVEKWIDTTMDFDVSGVTKQVFFGGKVDRIDIIDGKGLRVVDYKTGSQHLEFRGIESLFSEKLTSRNSAVLQTLLYSLLLNKITGNEIIPSLYYVRYMNAPGYSPLLVETIGEEGSSRLERVSVNNFTAYKEELSKKLKDTLSELFNPTIPFVRCTDRKTCENCTFREICNIY